MTNTQQEKEIRDRANKTMDMYDEQLGDGDPLLCQMTKQQDWEKEIRELINGISDYRHTVDDNVINKVKNLLKKEREKIADEIDEIRYGVNCDDIDSCLDDFQNKLKNK